MSNQEKDINKMKITGFVNYVDNQVRKSTYQDYIQASVISSIPLANPETGLVEGTKDTRHKLEIAGVNATEFMKQVKKGSTISVEGKLRQANFSTPSERTYSYVIDVDNFKVVDPKTPSENCLSIEGKLSKAPVFISREGYGQSVQLNVQTGFKLVDPNGNQSNRFTTHNMFLNRPEEVEAARGLGVGSRVKAEGEIKRFTRVVERPDTKESIKTNGYNIVVSSFQALAPEKKVEKAGADPSQQNRPGSLIQNTVTKEVEAGTLPKRAAEEMKFAKQTKEMNQESPSPAGM